MPNWCLCYVDIDCKNMSKKQFKKFKKCLTDDNLFVKDYNYELINFLDRTLEYVEEEKDKVLDAINELILNKCKENNMDEINFVDIMKHLYKFNRENPYNTIHIYVGKRKNILYLSQDLFNLYRESLNYEKPRYEYECITKSFSPDNPLSLTRQFNLSGSVKSKFGNNEKALLTEDDVETFQDVDDWYYSRINRLGTKWHPNVSDISFDDKDKEVNIVLESAWSPCINYFKHLTKIFDISVKMKYEEDGMCYAGECVIEDGEMIEDYTIEPANTIDSFINTNILFYENELPSLEDIIYNEREIECMDFDFSEYYEYDSEKLTKELLKNKEFTKILIEMLKECVSIGPEELKYYLKEIKKRCKKHKVKIKKKRV